MACSNKMSLFHVVKMRYKGGILQSFKVFFIVMEISPIQNLRSKLGDRIQIWRSSHAY